MPLETFCQQFSWAQEQNCFQLSYYPIVITPLEMLKLINLFWHAVENKWTPWHHEVAHQHSPIPVISEICYMTLALQWQHLPKLLNFHVWTVPIKKQQSSLGSPNCANTSKRLMGQGPVTVHLFTWEVSVWGPLAVLFSHAQGGGESHRGFLPQEINATRVSGQWPIITHNDLELKTAESVGWMKVNEVKHVIQCLKSENLRLLFCCIVFYLSLYSQQKMK